MNTRKDSTSKLKKDSSKQTLRDYLAGKARLKKAKSEDRLLQKADNSEPEKNPIKFFKTKIDEFRNYLRKNVEGEEVFKGSQKFIHEIIALFEKTVSILRPQVNSANQLFEPQFLRLSEKEFQFKSVNDTKLLTSLNEYKLSDFKSQKTLNLNKMLAKEDIDSPMVQSSPGKTRIKRHPEQRDSAKQPSLVLENILDIDNYEVTEKKRLEKKKSGLKMPPRVAKRMSKVDDL